MLPLVKSGALWARTGFADWRILGPMQPGKDPLEKLAEVVEQGLKDNAAERDSHALLQKLKQDDATVLAHRLRDFKNDDTAFLLVVDQFEELYTFPDAESRKRFDAQLANALEDPECPLFLITTVRADFLDRFELVPRLQAAYNRQGQNYSMPPISRQGLRDAIEQPARLAGLDVREVTTAILEDARDEPGALPLAENALLTLWEQRKGGVLSGELYRQQGGIVGMLRKRADALLARVDGEVPKGRDGALELLLRLTRVNEEGRHTRQRISGEEAVDVAGDRDNARGERIVQLLSGERSPDGQAAQHEGAMRLVVTHSEGEGRDRRRYVDLIHETLIRARGRDATTGKLVGYWPTLYDYNEKNKDRDLHRQQLRMQAEKWEEPRARPLVEPRQLAGLRRYRRLHPEKGSTQQRFLARSRRKLGVLVFLLAVPVFGAGVIGESAWWAAQNGLTTDYWLLRPLWLLGFLPDEPQMVRIPTGTYTMGCVPLGSDEDIYGKCRPDQIPAHAVTIAKPFVIGKYEVTFRQYDAFVFDQRRNGNQREFPDDRGWGRAERPVINVSWEGAQAYVKWLQKRTSKPYRLPTEAEWEYAARAGTSTAYWWGPMFDEKKSNCGATDRTEPVGSFEANPWGLHDTAGNVWEWVEDAYKGYTGEATTAAAVVSSHKNASRVLRGGSWGAPQESCSGTFRLSSDDLPVRRLDYIGFRVCCSSPIE
jgi:formylglycine-generating enzyme required for sulfatase activity